MFSPDWAGGFGPVLKTMLSSDLNALAVHALSVLSITLSLALGLLAEAKDLSREAGVEAACASSYVCLLNYTDWS